MKKALLAFFVLATTGCATWQTADSFEAGRLAAGALQDTAALACEGPEAEELNAQELRKCRELDDAVEKVKESLDALEAAWEDIAPVLGLPGEVKAPKSE